MTSAGATFRRVFGYEAEGLWAAPGRVNLIGEHTDYNDGLVLPFAIAQRAEAAIAPREDGHIRVCSEQNPGQITEVKVTGLRPGLPSGWAAYVAGVPWALECESGFDVAIDSSVPVGSGLSSSAAVLCSVAIGINEMFELGLSRRELARRTQKTENDYVGAPTGGMDQITSLLATIGHAILYDVRADTTEQVPFDPAGAGLTVLVIDSMIRHEHSGGEYRARRSECEESARRLGVPALRGVSVGDLPLAIKQLRDDLLIKRTRHVVTENQRVENLAGALSRGRWGRVGELLTEAHASYRDDFEASCVEVDVAVETVLAAGALGARLTGGGFGGAAIALVRAEDVSGIEDAVAAAYSSRGFRAAHMFTVAPSAGAERVV
ncbi:MAG: galactokinase [bacterium]|nr:galactokinase [bacterium]